MKQSLSKKDAKSVRKAVRLAKETQAPEIKKDKIKSALKPFPAKPTKKNSALMTAFRENIKDKRAKKASKCSKRTNTGVDLESPPHILHVEGKRWMKTLVKQNTENSRRLTKRLSKNR
jgi:hypothetical protein